MSQTDIPDPWTPFENLPAELRREVLRSVALFIGVACLAAAAIPVALTAFDLAMGGPAERSLHAGLSWFGAGEAVVLFAGSGFYLLLVGAGAWPAALSVARLGELYQISRDDLSITAYRRQRRSRD
jgi:hypothetical protein